MHQVKKCMCASVWGRSFTFVFQIFCAFLSNKRFVCCRQNYYNNSKKPAECCTTELYIYKLASPRSHKKWQAWYQQELSKSWQKNFTCQLHCYLLQLCLQQFQEKTSVPLSIACSSSAGMYWLSSPSSSWTHTHHLGLASSCVCTQQPTQVSLNNNAFWGSYK